MYKLFGLIVIFGTLVSIGVPLIGVLTPVFVVLLVVVGIGGLLHLMAELLK